MKKIISIYIIGLSLILTFEASAQKVGTTSLQFLKVMPTARATAMGDAFSSVALGIDAVFWNPAGITNLENQALTSTMTLWLLDTKQSAIAYGYSLGNYGTIAAQFQYVDYGSFKETRVDHLYFTGSGSSQVYNPGLTGRTFSPKSYLFGLSYARALTENFSTGVTVKYVRENLFDQAKVDVPNPAGGVDSYGTSANVVLIDFGIHYNTGYKSIQLGVSVQNFGSSVKFGKESYPAPLMFRLGTSADLIGLNALAMNDTDHRITLSYDIFQPNDYAQQMHTGFEYGFLETFFVRGGYKYNYDYEKFSFGAGVATMLTGVGLNLDYSYAGMGEYLGNVHRISLGVTL